LLETNCPNCESTSKKTVVMTKDYEIECDYEFTVSECLDCGLMYTSTRPEPEVLYRDFYPDNYLCYGIEHKKGIARFIDSMRMEKQAKERANLIKKFIPGQNVKLLEVGSATGEFLKFAHENYGWEADGVEPNEKLAAQSGAINATLEEARLKEDYYDVVCLFNVLEHLWNPREALVKLNKTLKKGGIIVAEVPDIDSPMRKFFQEHWFLYHLPRHLTHFSRKSLSDLMQKTGFKHVKTCKQFRPTVNALSLQYRTKVLSAANPLVLAFSIPFEIIHNTFYNSNIMLAIYEKDSAIL